ncbi:colicin-like pore-forming protein [Pectobacterium brasiliense]|uniref:colicin-like pore-forming protein n=1 Tax=Pectobacterium brasiliense TaxID=180957 RepID=UPI002A81D9C2|nr:colicin-like pore-forming protein [Pectobacterium brasiliense]MDY4380949.1 colicin-like pore-forming protein [Pectobacterium brasiliense]
MSRDYGDGTNWSSEKGSGSKPDNNDGPKGHGGERNDTNPSKDGTNNGSISVSWLVMGLGDIHRSKWGVVFIDFNGHPTMNNVLMTYENSSLVDNGEGGLTRVLNSLLTYNERDNNKKYQEKDNINQLVEEYTIPLNVYSAISRGEIPSGLWLENDNVMVEKVLKVDTYSRAKDRDITTYIKRKIEIPLLTKTYREWKQKDEQETLFKASELVAEIGGKISEHLGIKYKEISDEISNNIKNFQGKNIRNLNDAMVSLNKIILNPGMKVNQADKDAIINAWKHLDMKDMSNKLSNLGHAFKVADIVLKAEKIREKSIEGYETGNWKPLMLEVESWVLSGLAGSIALGIFSTLIAPLVLSAGLPATAVAITGILFASWVASLIDDNLVDKINNELIRSAH